MFLVGGGGGGWQQQQAASSSDGFWMTYPVYWFLWFLLCSDNASHKCEQCSEIGELHCGWLVDLDLDVVVVVPYSSFGMKVHGV